MAKRNYYIWTIAFKVSAHPDIVADGFNPTNPEINRSSRDVLDYISNIIGIWGEENINIELIKSKSPKLERILKEQGYKEEEIIKIVEMNMSPYSEEVSEDDCLLTIEEFLNDVKAGGLIDYDGYGNPVKNGKINPSIKIYPSSVDSIPKDATHICWYNR